MFSALCNIPNWFYSLSITGKLFNLFNSQLYAICTEELLSRLFTTLDVLIHCMIVPYIWKKSCVLQHFPTYKTFLVWGRDIQNYPAVQGPKLVTIGNLALKNTQKHKKRHFCTSIQYIFFDQTKESTRSKLYESEKSVSYFKCPQDGKMTD